MLSRVFPQLTEAVNLLLQIPSQALRRAPSHEAAVSLVLLVAASPVSASTLLYEDFESGTLPTQLSVSTKGTFVSPPGIDDFIGLDGQKAFGFGLSTNAASSFFNYVTTLTVSFAVPTYVESFSYIEMEAYGNWGSQGAFYVSGDYVPTDVSDPYVQAGSWSHDLGRFPQNDRIADIGYRYHSFVIDKTVTSLNLQVWDITNQSEIYVDDIEVNGIDPSAVPEPTSMTLAVIGIIGVCGIVLKPNLTRNKKAK